MKLGSRVGASVVAFCLGLLLPACADDGFAPGDEDPGTETDDAVASTASAIGVCARGWLAVVLEPGVNFRARPATGVANVLRVMGKGQLLRVEETGIPGDNNGFSWVRARRGSSRGYIASHLVSVSCPTGSSNDLAGGLNGIVRPLLAGC